MLTKNTGSVRVDFAQPFSLQVLTGRCMFRDYSWVKDCACILLPCAIFLDLKVDFLNCSSGVPINRVCVQRLAVGAVQCQSVAVHSQHGRVCSEEVGFGS